MDITIITAHSEKPFDSTQYFGILLSKSLTIIHMVHWYIQNYNAHQVLGDLYEDLDDLFDRLQEEIIGTSKTQNKPFPKFSPEMFMIDDLDQYNQDNEELMDTYYKTTVKLTAIMNSVEFSEYIDSIDSGLNNTREEVLSRINKANYLLAMIQL
jgi:DNA-binding ferritin-like protein